MSDMHIEEFYHDIGLVLARLYSSFPRKSIIYVEDISGPDTPDEYGMHTERHLSCLGAMIWLQEQGYINFESVMRQEAIEQAALTEKSFLMLSSQATIAVKEAEDFENLPPYAAKAAITNINVLRNALKSESAIQISEIVFHLLEQAQQYKR